MAVGRFLTKLQLEDIDGNTWMLLAPLVYEQDGRTYTVPAGFVTDLASIPRAVFWRPKSGRFNEAATIHDSAYAGELQTEPPYTLSRAEADGLFYYAMQALGVSWWSRTVMYRAVRIFGGALWHGAQETV